MEEITESEALWNHHALFIHPTKNLIGFEATYFGTNDELKKEHFVYTYENDTFVNKLQVDTVEPDGQYYFSRGTFIGDVFYVLVGNGAIKSYDLKTGSQLECLIP